MGRRWMERGGTEENGGWAAWRSSGWALQSCPTSADGGHTDRRISAFAGQIFVELVWGQFLESGGHASAERVDDRGHHGLAAAVGLAVGGDDQLVVAPRDM